MNLLEQDAGAGIEKLLGGRIDEDDLLLRPHQQDRHGQGIGDRPGRRLGRTKFRTRP